MFGNEESFERASLTMEQNKEVAPIMFEDTQEPSNIIWENLFKSKFSRFI